MTEEENRQDIRQHLKEAIEGQRVMLFMKGTPDTPRCGFPARMVGMLDSLGAEYAAMDSLAHPLIREELSEISGWPTIPQLFVGGELVGGGDTATEMLESGELAQALGVEQPAAAEPVAADAPQQPRPIQIGE